MAHITRITTIEAFEKATALNIYSAVIFERSPALKVALREEFEKIRANMAGRDISFRGDAVTRNVKLEAPGNLGIKNVPMVAQELQNMANSYVNTTGEKFIEFKMLLDFDFKEPHMHHYTVLNCAWFGLGSEWANKQGKAENAVEGDWLYMGEEFIHYSP